MSRLRTVAPAFFAAVIALVLVSVVSGPRAASAHPLGNFSINRLLVAELSGIRCSQCRITSWTPPKSPLFSVLAP